MSRAIEYLARDASRTWMRAKQTWSDRATPCTTCGYELAPNPDAPRCTECGKTINWNPSFLTDGKHHLLIPITLALFPVVIRAVSLKAELLWRANALELAQLNLPPNFDVLFLIDLIAFPLQFVLTALALVTSITWTRTLGHACARFAVISTILFAYWLIAPSAWQWL